MSSAALNPERTRDLMLAAVEPEHWALDESIKSERNNLSFVRPERLAGIIGKEVFEEAVSDIHRHGRKGSLIYAGEKLDIDGLDAGTVVRYDAEYLVKGGSLLDRRGAILPGSHEIPSNYGDLIGPKVLGESFWADHIRYHYRWNNWFAIVLPTTKGKRFFTYEYARTGRGKEWVTPPNAMWLNLPMHKDGAVGKTSYSGDGKHEEFELLYAAEVFEYTANTYDMLYRARLKTLSGRLLHLIQPRNLS